ncbi:helix-turn-helix domain-containing protein [Actinoallomurus spadix]|uniref:Helix-turn-helix transcriptional regulator n=1 Tax=Actinoallomurus spadix TaxID=79912 RepID=A0ABN0X364_9ACTN|nr:helix-turn-helix transcriptional regulator [Actinoallomurus spadix]MCO5991716.1 helix-turn-helix domain-containing protein [Actinoallomurus spadix]
MNQYYSPQAIWGRELRHYRKAASLTQAQLAEKIYCSESLISSIETGQAPATPEFAEAADEALTTGGALSRTLDWRKGTPAYPAWFVDWIPVEDTAVQLRVFEIDLIYGLFQTPGYAHALLGGDEAAVEARMLRQNVLSRQSPPPPTLYCVLDESALRRNVGGAQVMYEQLQHLLKLSERDNINIQIVPSRAHRGVRGPFAVATAEDGSETAQADNAFGGAVSTRPEDLATVGSSWESIRTEALPVDMSRDLIRRIAEELWST